MLDTGRSCVACFGLFFLPVFLFFVFRGGGEGGGAIVALFSYRSVRSFPLKATKWYSILLSLFLFVCVCARFGDFLLLFGGSIDAYHP